MKNESDILRAILFTLRVLTNAVFCLIGFEVGKYFFCN